MRPRPKVQAAAVAATITAVLLTGASSTPAATTQPDRLAILAGSSQHLVYADYPMTSANHPDYAHGELHVLAANGRNNNLGGSFGDTSPANAHPYVFSVVGSTLTGYSAADPTHVEWWDLAANTRGRATLPAGSRWQGSAPAGWLVVESDNATLAVETINGTLTSYGTPLPAETQAGGSITALTGPYGVVSLGAKSGTAAYQTWKAPSHAVSLDLGASAGSPGLSCDDVSGLMLGCVDRGTDGRGTIELAVPLDGSAPRTYSGCGAVPTAVGPRLVWVCGRNVAHPQFASGPTGHLQSATRVAPLPGVSALGSFVAVGHRQREIIRIRNAHQKYAVLVSIPSPIIRLDDGNLRLAAKAVEAQALKTGALSRPPKFQFPAQVLQASADALIRAARAKDPTLRPADTRSVMGPVPRHLRHHSHPQPPHRHIRATRSLAMFTHSVPDAGSPGIGTHRTHGGSAPAPFRTVDGVYVEPRLSMPSQPTIGMVALNAALMKLGQPYVWAGGGPSTFDCSGLVQWAYAKAGIRLVHFTGSQWNEGRLIKPRTILPGDLILFDHIVSGHEYIHHVGIYLGAGWMVNAPFTGQYVDVVRVPGGIAGVVRP